MDYTSSKNINIPSSGTDLIASVTQELSFNRAVNHTIESTITAVSGGELTVEGELLDWR